MEAPMGDTYDNAAEAEADRTQQKTLLAALGAWDRALRRDECGAWTITGERGSIHTYGDASTWIIFVSCRSDKHWTWLRKKLEAFCTTLLDCDSEGTLHLHRLPTDAEATVLREELGIRKKQEISDETRERLKAFAFERKTRSEPRNPANFALGEVPLSEAHPDQTPILDAEPAK
jgi:hypothetical protein